MFVSDFLSRFSSANDDEEPIPYLTETSLLHNNSYMSHLDNICQYSYKTNQGLCNLHSFPLTRSLAKLQKVANSTNTGHILIYLLSIICILILAHAIIKSLIKGIRYFCRYQTTTHFLCEHGHDKGPSAAIALEISTMSEITHIHIAPLNIPITRLSVHETDHNAYYIVSGNWFYDFLKLSQPLILLHRNGVIPIRTPITFEIRFFQSFKLRCILERDYLARVVTFQDGYMTSLSEIHICHSSLDVAPVRTLLATQSQHEPVETSSGLYPQMSLPDNIELPTITITNPTNTTPIPTTISETSTASTLQQVV